MKPPPALLFDMTSPMDAVQLDEQVVTSSGCPPPHCRWHWHYVVEPLEKAVQVVSGDKEGQNDMRNGPVKWSRLVLSTGQRDWGSRTKKARMRSQHAERHLREVNKKRK